MYKDVKPFRATAITLEEFKEATALYEDPAPAPEPKPEPKKEVDPKQAAVEEAAKKYVSKPKRKRKTRTKAQIQQYNAAVAFFKDALDR